MLAAGMGLVERNRMAREALRCDTRERSRPAAQLRRAGSISPRPVLEFPHGASRLDLPHGAAQHARCDVSLGIAGSSRHKAI